MFKPKEKFSQFIEFLFTIKEIISKEINTSSNNLNIKLTGEENLQEFIFENEIKEHGEKSVEYLLNLIINKAKTFQKEFNHQTRYEVKFKSENRYSEKLLNSISEIDQEFFQYYNQNHSNEKFKFLILDFDIIQKVISNHWLLKHLGSKQENILHIEFYFCINLETTEFLISKYLNIYPINMKLEIFEIINSEIKQKFEKIN